MTELEDFLIKNDITHFNYKELTYINKLKCYNEPDKSLWNNIIPTLLFLEFVRETLRDITGKDVKIKVYSAYRNLKNNRLVGSKDTSKHVQFAAIDNRAVNIDFKIYVNVIFNYWILYGERLKMGIGYYKSKRFIHIDLCQRSIATKWNDYESFRSYNSKYNKFIKPLTSNIIGI